MNQSKNFILALLVAGMSLGTAWAVRGQFGHEQGAAWAGGIGCLAVVLLAGRKGWQGNILRAALAGAIGWGLGGLMSYGIVVGYGRGTDFFNVYYGLAMLFVIGGLYGFLGGGLFGLALGETRQKPVDWPRLLVEMVAMALVFYFFLIMEWEWLMTPPRSELWAACLGMAVGLAWFLKRNANEAALRVAVYAGLGAGFGFGFGNFLQVLGNISGIEFNFWNVMEYSLGFFGGLGMAYGTFTAQWPENSGEPGRSRNWFPIVMLSLVIPLIVWDQSFETERLIKILEPLSNYEAASITYLTQLVAFLIIAVVGIYWTMVLYQKPLAESLSWLLSFFLSFFGLYILCSLLITGAFLSAYRIEQYLYIVNFIVVLLIIRKVNNEPVSFGAKTPNWAPVLLGVLVVLALAALLLVASHDELRGAHERF